MVNTEMMPVELFELAWNKPSIISKYSKTLSLLLGYEIKDFEDFKRAGGIINKMYRARGVSHGEYKDVVFYYKDIDARNYFKHPILAAMRGAVVREYSNGDVEQLAFPFAKFFGFGETPQTQRLPDISEKPIAKEKEDGTLIICWRDTETWGIRCNTRGALDMHAVIRGKTGYYMSATPGRVSNPYVIRFFNAVKRMGLEYELESIVKEDHTTMFELVYKIPASMEFDVLETPEDSPDWKPYFLAIRDHRTMGIIYRLDTAFPSPRQYRVSSFREALELVNSAEDREGLVLYYPNRFYHPELPWWNYFVKVKNRVYVLKSYVMSGAATWKHLALIVLKGKEDDLIPIVDAEKADFLREYRRKYNELLEIWRQFVYTALHHADRHGDTVYRVLANNLGAKHLIKYIKWIAKAEDKESAIERSLQSVVKKFLIYKNSKDAMLKALERFGRRIQRICRELDATMQGRR